ncbi:MAG: hypothetical protein ACJ76F_12580 [Bacteroidia bacterium]
MITKEYLLKESGNGACIYELANGISVSGIITACFREEPENFYYVAKGNLSTFKSCLDRKNYTEMRKLCTPISLSYVTGLRKAG